MVQHDRFEEMFRSFVTGDLTRRNLILRAAGLGAAAAVVGLPGAGAMAQARLAREAGADGRAGFVGLQIADVLRGVDLAKDVLLQNTERFARGLPANNALLWGARGMGKSSLIKAVHAAVAADGAVDLGPLAIRGYDEKVQVWRVM